LVPPTEFESVPPA